MSHETVHVVTDLPAPKKPFFLNKTYVKTIVATAALTGLAVVLHKNKNLIETEIDNVVTAN